eukprot:5420342-Prymnesium_polylepis.1
MAPSPCLACFSCVRPQIVEVGEMLLEVDRRRGGWCISLEGAAEHAHCGNVTVRVHRSAESFLTSSCIQREHATATPPRGVSNRAPTSPNTELAVSAPD